MTYWTRPNYELLYQILQDVMVKGSFKWGDAYDWETGSRFPSELP